MAATPAFPSAGRTAVVTLSAATTDKTGATTTNIGDILTGVAAGTRIRRIVIIADGNPADSTVMIFVHNGTAYKLWDDIDIGDPAASSTTVAGYRTERSYEDLILPSTSFKIAAAITVAPTSGNVNVWALGGDLT